MVKILVVDDSTINNILLQHMLQGEGYKVLTALNGYDALEIIQKEKIGIVLLDMMMPGFSGFDFLNELKLRKIKIPVIAISANTDDIFKIKSIDMGADDFLSKPIQFKLMMKKIKEIMAMAK